MSFTDPDAGSDTSPGVVPAVDKPKVVSPRVKASVKRGKDRWLDVLASINAIKDENARAAFIGSLADDPTDPEYSEFLRQAKGSMIPPSGVKPVAAFREQKSTAAQSDGTKPDKTITAGQAAINDARAGKRTAEEQRAYQNQVAIDSATGATYTNSQPIIKGMPVATGAATGDEDADGFLAQFAKNQRLNISQTNTDVAVRSGDYVYMGQVNDENGGPKFMRDQYVYSEDAKAQVAAIPAAEVKAIQKRLKLPETGVPDQTIVGLWDFAVESAQRAARAGIKATVKFFFDAAVENQAAGGSAGGGGATPLEDTDYYFAMMQVLGDISGVQG